MKSRETNSECIPIAFVSSSAISPRFRFSHTPPLAFSFARVRVLPSYFCFVPPFFRSTSKYVRRSRTNTQRQNKTFQCSLAFPCVTKKAFFFLLAFCSGSPFLEFLVSLSLRRFSSDSARFISRFLRSREAAGSASVFGFLFPPTFVSPTGIYLRPPLPPFCLSLGDASCLFVLCVRVL